MSTLRTHDNWKCESFWNARWVSTNRALLVGAGKWKSRKVEVGINGNDGVPTQPLFIFFGSDCISRFNKILIYAIDAQTGKQAAGFWCSNHNAIHLCFSLLHGSKSLEMWLQLIFSSNDVLSALAILQVKVKVSQIENF